ncbi:glycoside hydrolase TIM-barrel-like domain-containing protein [Pararhodobacter sp. CCB-MM2]|uniref:baseplate multidomain protein megatron n=1 Tax=Pararhodobacter sp. CCB-MM2 TaxID=1786003 RepID=UPI00082DEA1A|nr:glycoside hydrolase TIM-barrel-like domain-containing protein [Pararhodobacter sp. CCB-MM2]
MATLLLSSAGAAIGANFGGAILGLSGMVIGRAVGATLGRLIDQRLLGSGSGAVETGRIQRLQITGAGEGVALPRVWGRVRTAGHVIWASRFEEIPGASSQRKGGPRITEESRYIVSVAIALCEGEIGGIGRIWAYGDEIASADLNLRVYTGSLDQSPDPKILAVEGEASAPAYRGTAYVVIEDLDLGPFGNRLPNFAFEVIRAAQTESVTTLQDAVQGVAWLPGAGEYALATTKGHVSGNQTDVFIDDFSVIEATQDASVNVHTPSGFSDFTTSLNALQAELPNVQSGLLIASWFGDDLRCGDCQIRPKVESAERDNPGQPWSVAGLDRSTAEVVAQVSDRPVYGGTPDDASVLEAIAAMNAAGQAVVFYPFLLMEQLAGNGLPDPWSEADDQPALPWRGRITTSKAPGQAGTTDRTAAAEAEVAAFFGTAQASDFTVMPGAVNYSGPAEWSYRRFILHYAALCAASDGVEAFCIGSEMRSLTQIRGAGDSFPAVAALIELLREVRTILGASVKLVYAADWSEYFGYDAGEGNRYFHLDPLWSDDDLDVIGIDNYMPLADWREGEAHADWQAGFRDIYDLDYLAGNVAAGEGFDWYYETPQNRDAQLRTPITDEGEAEPWIWRYKDLRAWWENSHTERLGGVKQDDATEWLPRSKPVWFTEYGCAAIDKGANQPNVFLDPKSSESFAPYYSTGVRDDLMQMQYLRAMHGFWTDPANNPVSEYYGGPMVDWSRSHAWAWDARPWPWFPALTGTWSDGENWTRGHWLTGRSASQPLAAVVAEICDAAGITGYDVSHLYGVVRGYTVASTATGRAALQPLMLAHGFEALERDGQLIFRMRTGRAAVTLDPATLVAREGGDLELTRAPDPETAGRVRLSYVEAEGSFEIRSAEAVHPEDPAGDAATSELPMGLTRGEARTAVKRWLTEARIGRDTARFGLPMSSDLGVGDIVTLPQGDGTRHYRIDRMELTGARAFDAVRIEPGLYRHRDASDDLPLVGGYDGPVPVLPLWMDLPLMRGDEIPHAPHLAVTGTPWPGVIAVYDAPASEGSFALNTLIGLRASVGETRTALDAATPSLLQRGAGVEVRFPASVGPASIAEAELLDGKNLAAISTGDGWELFQYQSATLIEPGVWRLQDLLRGQFGTEPLIPQAWAPGAVVVLMDGAPEQLDLPASTRGVARRWRVGPAALAYDDPIYVESTQTFAGNGQRPYAPAHLTAKRSGGDLSLTWIRRTRVAGDGWDAPDVPLGEEVEAYLLRIRQGGTLLREVSLSAPAFTYTAAMQSGDGVSGLVEVEVAQVSGSYGPGLWATLSVAP